MRKSLKPEAGTGVVLAGDDRANDTARRAGSVERRARYRGGETSESGNPRALPARNKAGRSRAEQSVKRLRKPGGAAQSGEANPAWVAARFCKRRRVNKPHGRRSDLHHSFVGVQQADGADTRLSRCDIEGNRVKDDAVGAHRARRPRLSCGASHAPLRSMWGGDGEPSSYDSSLAPSAVTSAAGVVPVLSRGLGRGDPERADASLRTTVFDLGASRAETSWTPREAPWQRGECVDAMRFDCRSLACRSRAVCRLSALVSS